MTVFEPSHPPIWCQTHSSSLFHYVHDSPPPSPFYDLPIHFMTGPTRTEASSHRANPLLAANNPPRPPNAWILYRSDKLKELPQPAPGEPRRPQADISKMISAMWKAEAPDVRAQYERLSDIKKAEHQARYPGYRFQPMKKADKDRLKAERLAEKERERGARKSRARTRVGAGQEPPPLYTTEARFGPAGPSPPASSASTPPASHPSSQSQPAIVAQPTPPADDPVLSGDYHPTPAPLPSSPSPHPAPPSATHIPPIVSPQPGVVQRPPSPSDWQQQTQDGQMQPSDQEFNALWMDQGSLPDLSEYPMSQEYLTVSLSNHPSQHPLGWSPDDPSPFTDLPLYHSDPLHAVLSPTEDPNVFDLNDLDVDRLFDGSRPLEISIPTMPSNFAEMNPFTALSSLLNFDMPSQPDFSSLDPNDFASTSAGASSSQQQFSGQTMGFDPVQRSSTVTTINESLASYSLESMFDEQHHGSFGEPEHASTAASVPQACTTPTPQDTTQTPYVPPAGASNSSTRRVAADWRHIRLTPEPEPATRQVWTAYGQ